MADSGGGDGGPVVDLGISGYEGARELARGGFGVVYKARQPMFDRTVAIKVLTGASLDERMKERFERECQAMGALSGHPNIVTIYESGYTTEGRPYMVMELMAKGALSDALARRGSLPWQEAIDVGVKLAGGLEAAHRAGVLHRDLKPENVLISQYNESKLADFGIARVQGGVETRTGVVTASIMHAPPEILTGQRPSVAADVYSLGSTIYTLIAGAPAFFRETDESLIPTYTRISMEAPPDLRARGVPDPVARVLETALAKDPSYRYQTAADFGRALQEAQAACGIGPTPLVLDTGDDDHVSLAKGGGPVTGQPGYPAGTPSGGYPVTGQPGYPAGTPSGGYPVTGQPGYPVTGQGYPGAPSGGYPVTGQPGYPVTGQGYPGAPGGAPPSHTPPPHAPYGQPGSGAPPKKGKGGLIAAIVAAVLVLGGVGAALALAGGGDDDDVTEGTDGTTVRTDDTGTEETDPPEETTTTTEDGPVGPDSPEATLAITHGFTGDLTIAVGVADDIGDVLCEDVILEADPTREGVDIGETVDLDRCAEFYPPDAGNQWYIAVSDEYFGDVGTIEEFSVTGPDGEVYSPGELPVDIPDDYRTGVAVGTEGELVVFGSRVAPPAVPELAVAVTHDTSSAQIGSAIDVVAPDGTVLCTAPGPVLSEGRPFTATRIRVDSCAGFYPPTADQVWRVTFTDAAADGSVGQLQALRIEGPDGATYDLIDDLPLDLPEDAPVAVFFDGATASVGSLGGATGPATVSVTYSHEFPADIEILLAVVDGAGNVLCSSQLTTGEGTAGVTAQTDTFELTECLDQYPPSQERIWGLIVGDTAAADVGQLEAASFTGPDGAVFVPVQSLPIAIPDNDVDNPVIIAFRPS